MVFEALENNERIGPDLALQGTNLPNSCITVSDTRLNSSERSDDALNNNLPD
jgi:hypothetical protein